MAEKKYLKARVGGQQLLDRTVYVQVRANGQGCSYCVGGRAVDTLKHLRSEEFSGSDSEVQVLLALLLSGGSLEGPDNE